MRTGELYCWGEGTHGQLGYGGLQDQATPTRIGTDADWEDIATATTHSCGVRSGQLYCWGESAWGQLGVDADEPSVTQPARVGAADDWQDVTCNTRVTCGIRSGSLYCWGINAQGLLGDDNQSEYATPQLIDARTDWQAVDGGRCALREGQLFCWGHPVVYATPRLVTL